MHCTVHEAVDDHRLPLAATGITIGFSCMLDTDDIDYFISLTVYVFESSVCRHH